MNKFVDNLTIEKYFADMPEVEYILVNGDGYHYQLTVVTDIFNGKTKVARQQWVYACLKDYITSGQLHAITMETWTSAEWKVQNG